MTGADVRRFARALPDMARVGFAEVIAYRAEMAIWILSTTIPLIMLAVWDAVVVGGPISGWGRTEFARYFAVTLLVRQISSVWLVWELNYEIRSGRLSTRLLKPMHPLLQHGVPMLTGIPFRVLVLVPILVVLFVWRPDLWQAPTPAQFGLFVISMALAWGINFLVQALFAILAFWMDKTDALFGVWFALWSILSGYVAPLALFPEALRPVLILLPFRGMLGLPVEILGGFVSVREALPEVGLQLGWCVVLFGAVQWCWARGIARYGAYGA
jgi:ABC-2 type transport system permease protein